jgi:simple sugar transport system substrate-binding protein
MKKILALVLALVMVLCAASALAEGIKVGIINNPPSESGYRAANVKDFEDVFTAENGYETKTFFSKEHDPQIAAAKDFITEGVDYLLISAASTDGWDATLEEASEAGVKVLLFDREIYCDKELFIAGVVSDMEKEGKMAVDWLAAQELPEYNVIHIQGVVTSAASQGRTKFLQEKFDEGAMNCVVQQAGDWSADKAYDIVSSVINAKTPFNVIYAENDDMARGAIKALDDNNITHGIEGDVIVMGYDCVKENMRLLKAGLQNYDGQCSPFQAKVLDDLIKKIEAGEDISGLLNENKQIISDEKGFDAKTITDEDVGNSYAE